ncbi:MAG TPA: DHA2 family efflux MFS transporter permease subunit [Thermoleophilaceae bacterium]|nr:DHA2 family efflux MFS transporter permease subunit [Thermoleophilaceae bacterium]
MEASASGGTGPAARAKTLVLVAAILGTTVVTVDSTVVNVALPSISEDLGGGLAGQQWTSNAYLVTLGSLLLIGGSLGDIFGERRVFALGVVGFGATSLACALAPTIEMLVLARALQGVAGAALTPAALAVIVANFAPDERGKAVGAWTAWGGIGTVLGPLIGGQLVDSASWRWIFAINIPIVIVTLILILRVVPEGRERDPDARVDVVGAALCAFGLAGMTFGLIEQPLHGWGDPMVALPIAAGALLFVLFIVWEAKTPHAMLPLGLFKRHNFALGNVETFAMYGGLGLLFFFLVLFLQEVAGFSALEAGTASVPVTLVMFLLSTRFGALADRYGPRLFMGAGPLIAAAGMAWLLRLNADVEYLVDLLPGLLLFALGLSMTVAPLTSTVLADADDSNAGIASGVNNAIARVAGLVAIAAVGAVVAASFGSRLDDELGSQVAASPKVAAAVERAKTKPLAAVEVQGVPEDVQASVREAGQDASVGAFRVGMAIATALVALGGLLGLLGIRNPQRRVEARECPGGQLVGQPRDAARQSPCDWDAGLAA